MTVSDFNLHVIRILKVEEKNAEEFPKLDIKPQIQETKKLHIFKPLKTNGDQGQRENVNSCQNNNNKMLFTEGQGLRATAIFSSETLQTKRCAERKKQLSM